MYCVAHYEKKVTAQIAKLADSNLRRVETLREILIRVYMPPFMYVRLDFRRSLVSGSPSPSGEERGLLSRTAAGDRAYM